MTVSVTFRVDIRPYSGYSDPGLPIAAWIAQGGIAGDASGGNVILNFFFQLDDDPLISELFNLEQIAADTDGATSQEFIITFRNMDNLAFNRQLSDRIWRFQTTASLAGFSALTLDRADVLPLWIGAPNRDEGDSGIRIQAANVLNRLYQITLQGYLWGPRSVLAEGGPRRPPGGLFGDG